MLLQIEISIPLQVCKSIIIAGGLQISNLMDASLEIYRSGNSDAHQVATRRTAATAVIGPLKSHFGNYQ